MNKYYVYTVKSDKPDERINAFVEDPYLFALHSFKPEKMEFSGVYVEADTPELASQVYMQPKADDVFVSCDEPRPTELKRRAYESRMRLMQNKLTQMQASLTKAEQDVTRLRMNTLILEIAGTFAQLGVKISELTRLVREIAPESERSKFSNEEIYERLIKKYGEQLTQLKYRKSSSGE